MMTTGQMVFMAGAALLGLTAVLAVVFLIWRPKYTPGSAVFEKPNGSTQQLGSGYLTDPTAARRDVRQGAEAWAAGMQPPPGAVQGSPETQLQEGPESVGTELVESAEMMAGTDVL